MQIESEATGEPLWQRRALALTDRILEQFMADDGALAMTTNREHLLIELDADGDTVYPSGVSATIDLLIGLGAGNEDYAEAAMRVARQQRALRHVNANPATHDYLIPTEVLLPALTPDRVRYPEPVAFQPDFVDEPLAVYEGTPVLAAEFPKGAFDGMADIEATVRVQACDDQVCLPPSDLPVNVER